MWCVCFILIYTSLVKAQFTSLAQPVQQYLHITRSPQQITTYQLPGNLPTYTERYLTGLPTGYTEKYLLGQQPTAYTDRILPGNSPIAIPEIYRSSNLPGNLPVTLTTLPNNPPDIPAIPVSSNPLALQPEYLPGSTTGLPGLNFPNLVPNLVRNELPKPISTSTSAIDSTLLNNLAIALQLLIVNNILNIPQPEPGPKQALNEVPNLELQNYTPQMEAALPNSNFIGSSNFAEPNLVQKFGPTRNTMSLMSPYEALAPSTSYYEKGTSQFAPSFPQNPRKDFKSPYALIDKDFFGMSDIF